MNQLLRALVADRYEDTQETEVHLNWSGQQVSAAPNQGGNSPDSEVAGKPSTPIEVHENARANFDTKADALLSRLVRGPAEIVEESESSPGPASDQVVTVLPNDAVRGDIDAFRDAEGVVTARCFVHAGEIVGLQQDGYRALRELAEKLQRVRGFQAVVGSEMVVRLIFQWIRARFVGETEVPMVDYVISALTEQIAEFEVVIPLFRVELPGTIQIGRVTLRTITPADFERWEAVALGRTGRTRNEEAFRVVIERERKKMQGFAAALLTLRGVQEHVVQLARDEADEAVAILRLFAPAIVSPLSRSFCTLWGRENLSKTSHVLLSGKGLAIGTQVDSPHEYIWRITPERLELIRREALDSLTAELYSEKNDSFREEVKASLLLYSQSAMRSTPAEKLLAILIPLESLLLRNQSEPITEMIAVRLAFAIGKSLDERKRIVENVRAAYALRSAYVHHRHQITELDALDTLREFMQYAWTMFMEFGTRAIHYADRIAYLNSLDERKLA